MSAGVAPGPDGLLRCPWAMSAPEYLAYHDDEWGKPVTNVQGIYERMTLEAFQSGLSWITILRKRENFRRAFAGFQPEGVSAFTEDDIARLLSDPGIVRNRAKITAAIENARLVVDLGPTVCRDRARLSRDRTSPAGRGGVACHFAGVSSHGAEAQGSGLSFLRPDDGVRDDAGYRPGRRSRGGLLRASAGLG